MSERCLPFLKLRTIELSSLENGDRRPKSDSIGQIPSLKYNFARTHIHLPSQIEWASPPHFDQRKMAGSMRRLCIAAVLLGFFSDKAVVRRCGRLPLLGVFGKSESARESSRR